MSNSRRLSGTQHWCPVTRKGALLSLTMGVRAERVMGGDGDDLCGWLLADGAGNLPRCCPYTQLSSFPLLCHCHLHACPPEAPTPDRKNSKPKPRAPQPRACSGVRLATTLTTIQHPAGQRGGRGHLRIDLSLTIKDESQTHQRRPGGDFTSAG